MYKRQKFDRLIATVEQLNDVIANDDSLGEGFCIGHSYFCTNATINDCLLYTSISEELLINATENAKTKAEILCKASGNTLGQLLNIDYNWGELNVFSLSLIHI